MPDYKAMYFQLFNKVTDAIALLQKAQMDGENAFASFEDSLPIAILHAQEHDEKESSS